MEIRSLGLIETCGYVAAIEAADAGTKAANVSLLGYERGRAGLITIKFAGDVAAVRAAVSAASVAAGRVGKVVAVHVIARPDRQLGVLFEGERSQPLKAPKLIPLTAKVAQTPEAETEAPVEVSQPAEPIRQEPVEEQAIAPRVVEVAEVVTPAPPSPAEDIASAVVEPPKMPERANPPYPGPASSSKSRRNANAQKNKGKKKF